MKKSKWFNKILLIVLIILAIFSAYPIYLVVINSIKPYDKIFGSPLSFPKTLNFQSYIDTWTIIQYPRYLINSIIVTVITSSIIIFISAMSAYKLERTKTRLSSAIFLLFLSSILIPFQVLMVPLVRLAKDLQMKDSLLGLAVITASLGLTFAIFLYHGFIKGIPKALDEAAKIEGCGEFRIYISIILPLLSPVTITILILDSISTWNDFLLPLLLLNKDNVKTLPLLAYSFISRYGGDWDKQLAAIVLCMVPMVIFYMALQKYIVQGIAEGAVKG